MKVLLFWLVRTVLTVAAWLVLWAVGWHHWTSVVGAVVIAWAVNYLFLGSLYDSAADQMDRVLSRRFGKAERDAAAEEDAEIDSQA